MTLGQRIRLMRKRKGLSLEALGEKMGLSHTNISRWERDIFVPTNANLKTLADVLGVSVDYLISDEIVSHDSRVRELLQSVGVNPDTKVSSSGLALVARLYNANPSEFEDYILKINDLTSQINKLTNTYAKRVKILTDEYHVEVERLTAELNQVCMEFQQKYLQA